MDIYGFVVIGFYLVILLYSIILHEVAHGVAALLLGDRTALHEGRLTLRPGSHIDPFGSILMPAIILLVTQFRFAFGWARPVPYDPTRLRGGSWGPVLVALAGPGTNIALALIAALVGAALPLAAPVKVAIANGVGTSAWTDLSAVVSGSLSAIVFLICAIVISWNVLLAVFNLLPLPQLDGSKLLYAILPVGSAVKNVLEQAWLPLILIVVLFLGGPLSYVVGTVWSFFFAIALL